MILYHLTTPEKAEKIIADGKIFPGKFVGEPRFWAVFCRTAPDFDFVERDVIQGASTDYAVLQIGFETEEWFDDPDCEMYGPWVYHPTTEPLRFGFARIVRMETFSVSG